MYQTFTHGLDQHVKNQTNRNNFKNFIQKTNNLQFGLKNQVKDYKNELKVKNMELEQIKKNIKFCKTKEMEVDKIM